MRVPHQLNGNDDQRLTTTPGISSVREKSGLRACSRGPSGPTPQLSQLGTQLPPRGQGTGFPTRCALIPGMAASALARHVFRHLVAASTDSQFGRERGSSVSERICSTAVVSLSRRACRVNSKRLHRVLRRGQRADNQLSGRRAGALRQPRHRSRNTVSLDGTPFPGAGREQEPFQHLPTSVLGLYAGAAGSSASGHPDNVPSQSARHSLPMLGLTRGSSPVQAHCLRARRCSGPPHRVDPSFIAISEGGISARHAPGPRGRREGTSKERSDSFSSYSTARGQPQPADSRTGAATSGGGRRSTAA